MSETVLTTPKQLPEFNGGLSAWHRDVKVIEDALALPDGESCDFEAQLPEIVGYLSREEQSTVAALEETTSAETYNRGSYARNIDLAKKIFPSLFQIIEHDTELVSNGSTFIRWASYEKKFTPKGHSPKSSELHTDGVGGYDQRLQDAPSSIYLVSDTQPTIFYRGQARFLRSESRIDMQRNSPIVVDGSLVSSPPFAIVRLSLATVHASPIFTEDAIRTFIKVGAIVNN